MTASDKLASQDSPISTSTNPTTQWWAHRGTLKHENTARGVRDALCAGVDGVEIDLQLSADGRVFVFHDRRLKRLAGRPGKASELKWSELAEVELLNGERIPLLEELLDLWPAHLTLNLELKEGGAALVQALAPVLASFELEDVVLSSFDPTMINAAGMLAWPRAMLIERSSPAWIHASGAKLFGCPWVHLEACLYSQSLVQRYRGEGIELGIWGATSASEEAKLAEGGVARIISDFRVPAS